MWQLGFAWNGARDGMKSAQAMTNLRSLSSPSSILIFLMYLDNHESKVCFHHLYHLVMAWHGPAQSKYISTIVNSPCSSYREYIYFVLQRKHHSIMYFLLLSLWSDPTPAGSWCQVSRRVSHGMDHHLTWSCLCCLRMMIWRSRCCSQKWSWFHSRQDQDCHQPQSQSLSSLLSLLPLSLCWRVLLLPMKCK